MSDQPLDTSVNRLAITYPDRVIGSEAELAEMKLDPAEYLSCGEPKPGHARCPQHRSCTHAFKGKPGTEMYYDIEPDTGLNVDTALKVKVGPDGGPVMVEHTACGPKMLAIYHLDNGSIKPASKIQFMPCYRAIAAKKRWDQSSKVQPVADVIEIIAVEGDGQMVPMKETREIIIGTDNMGRPQRNARKVKVPRAVPFFERPRQFLVEKSMDLEIQEMVAKREGERRVRNIQGLPLEDRPIPFSGSTPPPEAPLDVRQAAKSAASKA